MALGHSMLGGNVRDYVRTYVTFQYACHVLPCCERAGVDISLESIVLVNMGLEQTHNHIGSVVILSWLELILPVI